MVQQFCKSKKRSAIVEFTINHKAEKRLAELGFAVKSSQKVKVRLARIKLDTGEDKILINYLIDGCQKTSLGIYIFYKKKLYKKPSKTQVNWYCTDDWKSFKKVFPSGVHLIGKTFTRHIEGINDAIRTFIRRSFRFLQITLLSQNNF